MRDRLSELLCDFAQKDKSVYVLSGDHGYSLFDALRKSTPEKFINVGVAEQAMVGIAAGMAKAGLRPIVYGLAAFIPIRVVEFIKMDVCYQALQVIFLGDGAGLVYSTLGSSHQCSEDMAVLQPLPNIKIYSPADSLELEYCFRQAMLSTESASYIRIGKSDKPSVHGNLSDAIPFGPCIQVTDRVKGSTVFATGSMVSTAIEIAKYLPITVISVPIPTDVDADMVREYSGESNNIITLEEHSIYGGLGSMISQIIANNSIPKKFYSFGLGRHFTHFASTYDVALSEHGLTVDQLKQRLGEIILE